MNEATWQLTVVLLAAAVIVEGVVLVAVMRQVGGILVQLKPPRPGEIEGGPDRGTVVDIPGTTIGKPKVVVFIDTGCNICKPLLTAIPTVRREYPEAEFVAIVSGDDDVHRASYARQLGDAARLDLAKLLKTWNVPGTPFGVAIDAAGVVSGSGVVNSLDQLEALTEALLSPAPDDAEASAIDVDELSSRPDAVHAIESIRSDKWNVGSEAQ